MHVTKIVALAMHRENGKHAHTAHVPERRSSVGVLSEEVRAHHPTPPSTALVARSGANSVSVMRFDVSLRQWHCATVPRWDTPEVRRRPSPSASPVCCNAPLYTRWPRLPGGGCACLERSAFVGQSGDFTAVVSPGCQDDAVPGSIYWHWHWQRVFVV